MHRCIAGSLTQWYVIDIQLVLTDKKEHKIQWAFKDLQFDTIVGVGNHGVMLASEYALAMEKLLATHT